MAKAEAKSRGLFNAKERRAERMRASDGTALSESAYNLVVGITLTAGLALTAVLTNVLAPVLTNLNVHPGILIVAWLLLVIGASFTISKTNNPVVGGAGFLVLSAAMGGLLAYALQAYNIKDIQTAVLVTGAVTGTMMLLSTMFPAFFRKLGPVLFIALLADIAVAFVAIFIFHVHLGILSWAGIVIFSLYIGYDWAKAQKYPKTVNNAINSAADVYVDIINLFLLILDVLDNK